MCELLNLYGMALEAVKPLAHCLLLLKVVAFYIPPRRASAGARADIFVQFVLASVTSVLQFVHVSAIAPQKEAF